MFILWGSKIAISHWQSQSPLTHGWRYCAARDQYNRGIVGIALLAANSVNRSKKKAGIFRINTDLAAKRSFYPRDAMLARMLSMALSLSVCLFVTSRWSTKRDKWIKLVFGTGAFPTYPTMWLKEIRVSAKKATSLWNSVPNSGLKNFASAYRLSKRVMDLARQRSTLRAWLTGPSSVS